MNGQIMDIDEEDHTDENVDVKELYTDLKDLEEYIQDLTSFLPIPLCTINPSQRIIDINASLLSLTGYKQHELMGKKVDIFLRNQQDAEQFRKNIKRESYIKNYDLNIITRNKNEIPVTLFSALRKDTDGDIIGYFITFIDISEIKQMEKSLSDKVEKLKQNKLAMLNIMEDLQDSEKEVKKRNKELLSTNQELKVAREQLSDLNFNLEKNVQERTAEIEKLLQQKDDFISQLGHDLKNPLGPLINLLPFLNEKEKDPESKKIFEVLQRNVDHIKNLVMKTIRLAKLGSTTQTLQLEDINLLSEINDVTERNKPLFDEYKIKIDKNINKEIMVKADKILLAELLDNLIGNAMKYSPDGGTINVNAKKEDNFVTISMSDTGMGMTMDQIENIFNEFYKADDSRHDFDSSGLGLSICKRIIEKHKGKIWADSNGPGKGSTLYFTLPLIIKDEKLKVSVINN